MQVQGSRIHITGSAKSDISPDLLRYGHVFIEALVPHPADKVLSNRISHWFSRQSLFLQ